MTAPAPTWSGLIGRLVARQDLDEAETAWAMREIMSRRGDPGAGRRLRRGLRAKGEAPAEVAGMAATMVERATPVQLPVECVDIVGTVATAPTR